MASGLRYLARRDFLACLKWTNLTTPKRIKNRFLCLNAVAYRGDVGGLTASKLTPRCDGNYGVIRSFGVTTSQRQTTVTFSDVTLSSEHRFLVAQWQGGDRTDVYPYAWLRDNCQCKKCFHPFTKARLILMRNLKLDATPAKIEIQPDGSDVTVTWDDGHVSRWDAQWLWERRFTPDGQNWRKRYIHRTPKLWGEEMLENIAQFDFEQLLSDDKTLYNWTCAMEDYGFAMFKNTPKKTGQLRRLAEHISFLRSTHYGHNFQVRTSANPSNLAYTSGDLGLHTDIPYDRYPPGIQFLHYITQTPMEGGLSEFSDAFNAAAQLRQENPEAFRILVETPVDYIDVGTDEFGKFSKLDPQYTINLDSEGEIFRVMYSNQCRDSHFRVAPEVAEKFLRALHQFDALLYRKGNIISLKPEEGDVCMFYNNRVLHGRTSYEMTPGLERHLEGMYMDVDEITSKRRVLQEGFQAAGIHA